MSLSIATITLEFFWGHYAFCSWGSREVAIKFSAGLPFWFLSRERQGATLELWGFGMNLVTNPS